MNPIVIGQNAAGKPITITPQMRQSTHMHVIGGSGKGKSKFLEWMIRRDIREGHGFCLIDWHGTLYKDVLRYCSQLDVGLDRDFRSLVLINPSQPHFVTGFNPFMNQGADIATQVSRRIDATIRPWGITDTNQMPTFERVCRLLYTFAVEQQETLPNAAQLLQFDKPELREYAVAVIQDSYIRQQWQQLAQLKSFRDWKEFVLSTENRLSRFLASKTIKRFMGMTSGNIDLIEAMNQGKIILVNLGSSGFLDRESARVFASLFLNEFFESAMLRATEVRQEEKPRTFTLYLDEFQEYITDDIGSMLDQVRKGGLHMVLAHQHLGHLVDNERLMQSVLTNARIRAVFGGLPYTDACLLGNEMFLPDLNTRQIKKAYYHTIHLYEEQNRTIRSQTEGRGSASGSNWSRGQSSGTNLGGGDTSMSGEGHSVTTSFPANFGPGREGWFDSVSDSNAEASSSFFSEATSEFSSDGGSESTSESHSEGQTEVPVWVPIPVEELGSEAEWSREEKLSKVAEMLKHQQERHCFIKFDTEPTQPLLIPFVQAYSQSDESLLEYEKAVYDIQGALPGPQVDQILEENEKRFLTSATTRHIREKSTDAIDVTTSGRPKQKEPSGSTRSARAQLFSKIEADKLLDD